MLKGLGAGKRRASSAWASCRPDRATKPPTGSRRESWPSECHRTESCGWGSRAPASRSTQAGARSSSEPAYPFAYGLFRSRAPSAGWSQVSDAINPRAIAFDLQGRALIGSAQGEVHRWDGSSLRSLFERLPTGVSCMAVDGPGRLIIGTPVEAWVSDANGTKPKLIAKRFSERGPWGSFEGEAIDFVSLTTDSEGSVWGATADGLVARLTAAPRLRWESHNLGLAVIEGKGRREPSPAPTAIAAHPSGAILLSHSRPGLFCVKPA